MLAFFHAELLLDQNTKLLIEHHSKSARLPSCSRRVILFMGNDVKLLSKLFQRSSDQPQRDQAECGQPQGRDGAPSNRAANARAFKARLTDWKNAGPPAESTARKQAFKKISKAYTNDAPDLCLTTHASQPAFVALRVGERPVVDRTTLSTLPDCMDQLRSLKRLDVSKEALARLPALPPGLTELRADCCPLTSLPSPLPPGLVTLDLDYNRLREIPELPRTMRFVSVRDNALEALPELPPGLMVLDVSANRLTDLPSLPSTLVRLTVTSNALRNIPPLPPGLEEFDATSNAALDSSTTVTHFSAAYDRKLAARAEEQASYEAWARRG